MHYDTKQFAEVVGADNIGQVTQFKGYLRKYGVVTRNRAPLTEKEVVIFNNIREAKAQHNLSWDQAAEKILGGNKVEDLINTIVNNLQALERELDATNDIESERYYNAMPLTPGTETIDELINRFITWRSNLNRKH